MGQKRLKLTAVILTHVFVTSMVLIACGQTQESSNYVSTDEYAITLHYNDGSSRPFTMYIEKGASIAQNEIDIPIRKGYTFKNWTIDDAGATVVSFPYTPAGDVSFYAQWDVSKINVTFDYNLGADSTASERSYVMQVNYNSNITQADVDAVNARVPEWQGHVFAEYWETENGTSPRGQSFCRNRSGNRPHACAYRRNSCNLHVHRHNRTLALQRLRTGLQQFAGK